LFSYCECCSNDSLLEIAGALARAIRNSNRVERSRNSHRHRDVDRTWIGVASMRLEPGRFSTDRQFPRHSTGFCHGRSHAMNGRARCGLFQKSALESRTIWEALTEDSHKTRGLVKRIEREVSQSRLKRILRKADLHRKALGRREFLSKRVVVCNKPDSWELYEQNSNALPRLSCRRCSTR
jgi:hypothetical protein